MDKAKAYSLCKYITALIDTAYTLAFLFLFLGLGFSKALADKVYLPAYILTVFLLYYVLSFPLHFYQSYLLERKFCLSTQRVSGWLADQLKTGVISYLITLIIAGVFYFTQARWPQYWWFALSLFWIFFSLVLAKLFPVIILPLFFKYKKLSDESLRGRIMNLAEKMGIKIMDVFEIDFSKKTLKANAALIGMGSTRRVILADTLRDKYSAEEIEVILAHEFAHYRLKHMIKLVLINCVVTILSFYLLFKTASFSLGLFGLTSLEELAALPLVAVYLMLLGIILQPWQNFLSRKMEQNADSAALKTTGLKEQFISLMEKLGSQNLVDKKPHPLIKFYFFDHPPIDERINIVKSL